MIADVAEPAQATAPPRTKPIGRVSKIDWTKARTLRDEGNTFATVASLMGITEAAMRKHATRNNWPRPPIYVEPTPDCPNVTLSDCPTPQDVVKDVTRASKLAVERIKDAIQTTADQHVARVKTIVPTVLDELSRRVTEDVQSVPTKELLQITQTLELADKVGRRSHGLDVGDGRFAAGMRQTINISFNQPAEQVQAAKDHPIDV